MRVTALRQPATACRRASASICGCQVRSSAQFAAQVLQVGPEADGQPGGIGGPQGRGFGDLRPDHRHVEDVGLKLHQQRVGDHAAVHLEPGQGHAGIEVHGLDDVMGLVRAGLQNGPGNMSPVGKARQADDDPAGVRAPVGGEQAGKGRHEIGAPVVRHATGQGLDLGRRLDDAQVVAQPLYQGPGDGDGALQAVDRRRRAGTDRPPW